MAELQYSLCVCRARNMFVTFEISCLELLRMYILHVLLLLSLLLIIVVIIIH